MKLIFSLAAKQDLINIINYTIDNWGEKQAVIYKDYLKIAEKTLKDNPYTPLSKSRNELGNNFRSLAIKKHLIFYHLKNESTIEVIRILHQSMDFKLHL